MKKPLLYLLILLVTVFSTSCSQSSKETFEIGDKTFLLNGKPFVVKAAEIHYPRIPKEYWEHRIKMCKALGMNTICLYVFWNFHEPEEGKYDFTGQKDIAAFCRLAQENGMYVIVRPGPYVCAEWEMGGLPWWLLKKKDIKLREQDPYYMERVKLFMNEVGKQLTDLQISKGGNIIMVQVENEYGSFGIDKPYIAEIRDIVKQAGFTEVPLFQCDWNSNFENNALDDLLWTINFGTGANIDDQFKRLQELRPDIPLMCSEFWSGWFDHWGAKHETRSAEDLEKGMKETVLSIIKVIFAQLVLTAVVILLASFITYKLKVSDFGYKVIVMVVYGIVTFIGGMIIGKVKNKRKFLWGALTGGIYIGYIFFLDSLNNAKNLPVEIEECESVNYENLSFLATYIIPLVCFPMETERQIFVMFSVIIVIGCIFVKTNLYYTNPSLVLLGFNVYKVRCKSGNAFGTGIVIIKGKLNVKDNIKYMSLSDNVYFARRI